MSRPGPDPTKDDQPATTAVDAMSAGQGDPLTAGLDVYIVGGAVRDALLGETPGDRDWVVVGAEPQAMEERGFIPVGGDFPVFLHPRTKEEYALARTERKSGRGYRGFTFYTGPDVTLEDDLGRRDLTMNAIARASDGRLIDPLGGQTDIHNRTLRHVGQAFIEDPVRLLRLARFAARFPEFRVATETQSLACRLVENGEVDALVPERVWQEIAKGLMTQNPGRMFQVLQETGALARVMPGLRLAETTDAELRCAAQRSLPLASRFALVCRHSDDPPQLAASIRAPGECQDSARLLPEVIDNAQDSPNAQADTGMRAAQSLELLLRCDALRKPGRFVELLRAGGCVINIDHALWTRRMDAVRGIDAGAIARQAGPQPDDIKKALRQARLEALKKLV